MHRVKPLLNKIQALFQASGLFTVYCFLATHFKIIIIH